MSERYKPNTRLGAAFKRFARLQGYSNCDSHVLGFSDNEVWETGSGQAFIEKTIHNEELLLAVFTYQKNTAAVIINNQGDFLKCSSQPGIKNLKLYTVPQDFCQEVEQALAA